MAHIVEVNDFAQDVEFLETMFGGTVSTAVIATVLESCNGNVHLAADAIMNFSDEMSTPSLKDTENIDVSPVRVKPELNVDAQPFEYIQPQTTTLQTSLTMSQQTVIPHLLTDQIQEQPTSTILAPEYVNEPSLSEVRESSFVSENLYPSSSGQQSPLVVNQEPLTTRQRQSTSAWQPPSTYNQQPPSTTSHLSTAEALSVSFSEAFRNSGALPKKPPDSNPQKPRYTMKNEWRDQIGKILHYHNQGTRILIIMRGLPGSGKTYLAKHIVDYAVGPSSQNYSRHIFSTDNHFMRGGVYQFNRDALTEAHAMNQRKVCEATNEGLSPVIVDNTNTELWEMEPYIRDGMRNGYMIEFVEPRTPWARNLIQLEKRNIHGVARDGIRRMLDRYDRGITPESAMRSLRLTYPPNRTPPVLRKIPPFSPPGSRRESPKRVNIKDNTDQETNNSRVTTADQEIPESSPETQTLDDQIENLPYDDVISNDEHESKVKKIIEAQLKLEQFEKVVQEWENGESWDSVTEENKNSSQNLSEPTDPKPPRAAESKKSDKLIESFEICDDWAKFMPSWRDSNNTQSITTVEASAHVESKSIGTSFEAEDMAGDMHVHTILYGNPRDINENSPENTTNKIPKAIVFDKSTATHDNDFLSKKEVCKNKEHHFRELRRMFRSVSRQSLRDIFESCNFDVNWAVNLVLDSYPESQEMFNTDVTVSDDECEEPMEVCNCLAGYNIIPDMAPNVQVESSPEVDNASQTSALTAQKKPKRENKLSDDSLQLKKQIESNVVIPDKHYSQHYLNLRRRRENYIDGSDGSAAMSNIDNISQSNLSASDPLENSTTLPGSTQNTFMYNNVDDFRDVAGPSTASHNSQLLDTDIIDSDTESESNKSDNPETMITINLGREFLAKLDDLFGRNDILYPDNIQPVVNLPISILQQINAHWVMSVAAQLDDGSRQSEAMIKQDEDFARNLSAKEQEMSEEGKEPEVPTLKEIMDMELAYTIYERNVADWRKNEPQDMAAKLSREKLYSLFPDLSKEVLSEMLMAHDYSFKATIESLIISTGQTSWLEDEKGVEKFVMHKEMERKEKFLEQQQKNLDEAEWPHLSKPDKPITLETVNFYRAEAEKSLQNRNINFEKARQYFARNNPSAASFYSDIAALHTRKYEQSSSLAAAYLMHYHLMNNPDHDVLDLHFLRVQEAMFNLDIFVDEVIMRLRTNNIRYKQTWIITGKGIHSPGGPRIKPAAKRRLHDRDITIKQVNGGMLMAEIRSTNKMTSELAENSS